MMRTFLLRQLGARTSTSIGLKRDTLTITNSTRHLKLRLEIREYILGVVRIAFFLLLYIIYSLILHSRGLTECNKKYQAIVSKRTRFSQRLRMFFTRNYIETGN